ncbi:MAG: FAD-linked oxidase C-terminal domain-containing protein, partial [Bryobacteraceae bacterium]
MHAQIAKPSIAAACEELQTLLGPRAQTGDAVREHHSHGESYHAAAMPDIVCFPASVEEVSAILRVSQRHQLPVIPFGAGSSLEGHVNALYGGISIDMREMNKVTRVSVADLDVTVEAGVTRNQLNKALTNTGLMFFIDPGADATIGGMAATRASGTTAVRYGTMRENVLALTVVLADGTVIKTGTRARKSSAGYDLTRLFVGSEGTLGVITDVTLRLHPVPEAVSAAVCGFQTIRGAIETVIEVIQLGVGVARAELLDEASIAAVNAHAGTNYAKLPTLFFEFHGLSEAQVAEQAGLVQSLAQEHGGAGFEWATKLDDRERLWHARHHAFYSALASRPGSKGWATDVCVPISRLADCILESQEDHASAAFPAPLVGHVGDGNFHLCYILDPKNDAEFAEAARLSGRMVERTLQMGGTCTGEHGVGYGKRAYLESEHGAGLEV